MSDAAAFAIVFEYRVAEPRSRAFERTFGGDGAWAQFFQEDPAYPGSELWAFEGEPGRYVIVDRWDSADAYRAFRERNRAEYERRSAAAESLYETERIVGELRRC